MKKFLAYEFLKDSGINDAATPSGYTVGAVNEKTIATQIGSYIQIVTAFVGVLFLILMIYAGYLWMTARGNEEQITKAKNLIIAAIIGLIIVLAAYAITAFIGQQIVK